VFQKETFFELKRRGGSNSVLSQVEAVSDSLPAIDVDNQESHLKASVKGFLLLVAGLAVTSCAPSAPQLKKIMEENPDILYGVIQKDPKKFLDVVNDAAQKARAGEESKFAEDEAKAREEEMKNPKKPELGGDRAFAGTDGAPITIVEYSDFQCPYCKRGHETMAAVLEKYSGKVKIIFKDMPIERIHPLARPGADMYEAIALQDKAKATKFKDYVFDHQDQLNKEGPKFYEEVAKKVGANVAKAKKDAAGDEVKKRIEADKAEGEKFGFTGTPGYLVNGVSLKGAYPIEEFQKIIDKMLAKN
jgi:protein-disulfide isomerase